VKFPNSARKDFLNLLLERISTEAVPPALFAVSRVLQGVSWFAPLTASKELSCSIDVLSLAWA